MNAPAKVQQQSRAPYRFTLDDVFKMMEAGVLAADARVELIDGVLVEMSPQNPPDARAKMALARFLYRMLPDELTTIVDSTLRLSDYEAPEPDLYVYPEVIPLRSLTGPEVLLVVEVADTSLATDLGPKARLYARYEVPEYWVLDTSSRRLTVHTDPRLDGYARLRIVQPEETIVPERLPGIALRIADLPPFE